MPPNDAKAQIRYAFHVTGASILSTSCVVERLAMWAAAAAGASFS
jgi:hypothetical protein